MADRVGQQVGNYRLIRLLGQGGFAEVYLGEHIHLGTLAAIKVLHLHLSSSDEIEHFLAEARVIATLDHPNIVRVLDFGVENGTAYLVMDYAPNGTLREKYPPGSQVPPAIVASYVKQIAGALQNAHAHKLIHRDIKPENLLLGSQGQILLSDFGIALVAQSSHSQSTKEAAGTVAYMAPEQIQGHPRPASDQYALALIAYEWLTGAPPFQGSFTEIATQQLFAAPTPLREKVSALSPEEEQVVMIGLSKDTKERFGSVQAFATALEQAAARSEYQPTSPGDTRRNLDPATFASTTQFPALPTIDAPTTITPPSWNIELTAGFPQPSSAEETTFTSGLPERPAPAIPTSGPSASPALPPATWATEITIPSSTLPIPPAPPTSAPVSGPLPPRPSPARPPVRPPAPGGSASSVRDRPARPTPVIPPALPQESLQFTAFHPKEVAVDTWNTMLVYTHVAAALGAIRADAGTFKAVIGGAPREVQSQARRTVTRGTKITVVARCKGVTFNPRRVSFLWLEDWHRAEFRFMVEPHLAGSAGNGLITIYAGPLIIATIKIPMLFEMQQAPAQSIAAPTVTTSTQYRHVFASYSHKDTQVVLACRNAYKALGDDVLIDIDSLRSGQAFQPALMRLIETSDVFQLFWSAQSAASPYVRLEWEHALRQNKGESFIRPVYWKEPIVSPPEPLAHLHFDYQELPEFRVRRWWWPFR